MAATFTFFRQSARLFAKQTHLSKCLKFHTSSVQCLFGDEKLGLDNYQRQRVYMQEKVGDLKERFRVRMEDYLSSSNSNTIFTDDVKTMVHVADSQADLDTAVKMIKRFHNQSRVLRFSSFVFGPLVMRMLHSLQRADLAYSLFMDPELTGFFSQVSSYILVMDLLFEVGQHQEVLEVMDVVLDAQLGGFRQPMDCITLAMAACLKLNTKESLDYALKCLKRCEEDGSTLTLRTLVYAVYLASKQKQYDIASEILSLSKGSKSGRTPAAYANVKAIVLAQGGTPREAMAVLEDVAQQLQDSHEQMQTVQTIFPETLQAIEEAVEKAGERDLQVYMDRLLKDLHDSGNVSQTSFDDYIFQPIIRRRSLQDGFKRRERSGIQGYNRPAGRQEYHRRGLNDDENMVL